MGVVRLKLLRGEIALIDKADWKLVLGRRWRAQYRILANGERQIAGVVSGTAPLGTFIYLHRLLMAPPKGMVVDHIDGDPLNNTRANLRVCTHADNMKNRAVDRRSTSGLKGIQMRQGVRGPTYTVTLCADGKRMYFGTFKSKERAASVYAEAAKKYHGEFARLA